jgi:hypothetical protein
MIAGPVRPPHRPRVAQAHGIEEAAALGTRTIAASTQVVTTLWTDAIVALTEAPRDEQMIVLQDEREDKRPQWNRQHRQE